MHKSVLVVLLVSALLVADTDAGWFRRTVDKVKNVAKKVVKKVVDFAKKHGPKIFPHILGKRSVDMRGGGMGPPPLLTEDDLPSGYMQTMLELQEACPGFGVDVNTKLDIDTMVDIFNEIDENGDRNMDPEELEMFDLSSYILEACMMLAKGEQPPPAPAQLPALR